MSVRYDFIFDNPFETLDETLASFELMLELPQPFTINPFSLKFFPHTEITERALQQGLIDRDKVDDSQGRWQDNYLVSDVGVSGKVKAVHDLISVVNRDAGMGRLNPTQIGREIESIRRSFR